MGTPRGFHGDSVGVQWALARCLKRRGVPRGTCRNPRRTCAEHLRNGFSLFFLLMNVWGSSLDINEILEYHVKKEHGSALNYTRDASGHPVRQMVMMLADVYDGKFILDAPRDAVFPDNSARTSIATTFERVVGLSVREAASRMAGDQAHMSVADKKKADERFNRLMVEPGVSRSGLVGHLNADEEHALYHPSG